MPSSMIFAGLVVIWLLILVPAVAQRRQEVARPSGAALGGRVLERPRRPEVEVDDMAEVDDRRTATETVPRVPAARAPVEDDLGEPVDDRTWDRPEPRYRRGRGGFDAEAAALAARARATFRQRVVVGLLLAALVTAVIAAAAISAFWWLHVAVDLGLVGYLVYLRRQVRMEEAIRERRAARMAGARRRPAEPEPSVPAAPEPVAEEVPVAAEDDDEVEHTPEESTADDLLREEPERVSGTGAPLPRIVTSLDELTVESALPRLQPAPPPPLPAGTVLVEADDEDDPELHELDSASRPDYRRAAGE